MKSHQHGWGMTAIISTLLVCNMAVQMVKAQPEAEVPKVIEAQEFRLVNTRRQTLATMSIGPDGGPRIALFDGFGQSDSEPGAKRLELGVSPSDDGNYSPHLKLNDDGGKPRLSLFLTEFKGDNNAPQIQIMDKNNQARGIFGINANNNPDLILSGDTGATTVLKPEKLSISAGDGKWFGTTWLIGGRGPGLVFADGNGKWIWTAPPQKIIKKASP